MPACRTCGRGFRTPFALVDHQRSTCHYDCCYCNHTVADESSLEQHCAELHPLCVTCDKMFSHADALRDHQQSKKHLPCPECNGLFTTEANMNVHYSAVHRHVCGCCNKTFEASDALQSHQRAKNHCYCIECNEFFASQALLAEHLLSLVHVSQYHCCNCDRDFIHQEALDQHLRDKVHGTQANWRTTLPNGDGYSCKQCRRAFTSKSALDQHLRDKIHDYDSSNESSLSDNEFFCDKCDRMFVNQVALDQHLASLVHKPLSNLKCIASSKCKAHFTSPSALLHHLESGGCRSGLTRKKLNQLVQNSDVDRLISSDLGDMNLSSSAPSISELSSLLGCTAIQTSTTIGTKTPVRNPIDDWIASRNSNHPTENTAGPQMGLVGGGAFSPAPSFNTSGTASPIFTPGTDETQSQHSQNVVPPTPQSPSDQLSALGVPIAITGLFCPLCPPHRKPFHSTVALQSHLASPAHAPKQFHCPTKLLPFPENGKTKVVIKHFSTLSGLTQHIENGSCDGGSSMLQKAIGFVEGRLHEMGFGNVRLLSR